MTPHDQPRPEAPAHFVGREQELQALLAAWQKAQHCEPQIVLVSGEAGIGKTSLAKAFVSRLNEPGPSEQPAVVAVGRCQLQQGECEPFMPALEALEQAIEAQPDRALAIDTIAREAPSWAVQMPWLWSAQQLQELAASVQGIGPARMLREGAHVISSLAKSTPLVLWIEDLHWCDSATLDLVATISRRQAPTQLLVICTFRASAAQISGHPLTASVDTLTPLDNVVHLQLAALNETEVENYLDQRFGDTEDFDWAAVRDRCGGNPLFLEALSGAVRRGEDLHKRSGASLPESIATLLRLQLAELPKLQKEILKAASVAGGQFTAAEVAAGTDSDGLHVERLFEQLAAADFFLQRTGDSRWPDNTVSSQFAFHHDVYRQHLLQGLSAVRSRELHRRIGLRLEAAYEGCTEQIAAQLAGHFEAAGDIERHVRYLEVAASHAHQRFSFSHAVVLLRRAAEALDGLPEPQQQARRSAERWTQLATVRTWLEGYSHPEVREALDRAYALSAASGDADIILRSHMGRTLNAALTGSEDAPQLCEDLLELAQDRPSFYPLACLRAAFDAYGRGRFDRTLELMQEVTQANEDELEPQTWDIIVAAHGYSAWALHIQGRHREALLARRQMLKRLDSATNPYDRLLIWASEATAACLARDFEVAAKAAKRAITIADENGFEWYGDAGRVLHTWASYNLEPSLESVERLDQVFKKREPTGPIFLGGLYRSWQSEAHLRQGDLEGAYKALTQPSIAADQAHSAELQRLMAEIQFAQREADGIETTTGSERGFHLAIQMAQQQGAYLYELRARNSLFRHLVRVGRKGEAREQLRRYCESGRAFDDSTDAREAQLLLTLKTAQLELPTENAIEDELEPLDTNVHVMSSS